MTHVVTGGRVNGGGPGPRGEMALGREPGDVTDLDQQPRRPGRADAVQVQQRGSGGLDQRDEFLVRRFLPRVEPFEVA